MELREFINNTLTEIANGVGDAIAMASGKGYFVNPSPDRIGATCTIHFDLSVESTKEGEARIKVLGGSMAEHNTNRISFDIGMTLPTSGNIRAPKRPVCGNDGTDPCIQTDTATQKQ